MHMLSDPGLLSNRVIPTLPMGRARKILQNPCKYSVKKGIMIDVLSKDAERKDRHFSVTVSYRTPKLPPYPYG